MGRGAPVGRGAPSLSMKARAIQWLAQREHSRTELRRKLLRLAIKDAAAALGANAMEADAAEADAGEADEAAADARVDALLDWLEANRYLSQQRFVESRVHAREARFGNLRIRQELAQHQLALPTEIASALKGTELARARAVRETRFGSAGPADTAERGRQARFLAGRGFSGDVIHRVLRDSGGQPDAD
ncbi:MAG: hypothetical protein AD742_06760 [Methylibium sp. NZG]|nr:MAG: hypothetical protein AD742_06760 [Methylibium sp. NZG]